MCTQEVFDLIYSRQYVLCQSLTKNKKSFQWFVVYFEIIFSGTVLISYKILKKKEVVEFFKQKPLTKISPFDRSLKNESDDL